ncbi:MAG: type 1 glutamine amidotransferase [Pseudomonadota bacterium]
MRIAILMTNTDESAFAQRHPKDGEKFTALIRLARPGWSYPVYAVKDGEFPDTLEFDGVIITGSPASPRAGEPWMDRLEALVRDLINAGVPMFGACFGHQIIAKALGARLGDNPGGWVKGVVAAEYDGAVLPAYASHTEQVLTLPKGAETIASHPSCAIAGYRIGTQVETTQYHPEMTQDFFAALLDEYAHDLPPDVSAAARASLQVEPDRAEWAERIAGFFERASRS